MIGFGLLIVWAGYTGFAYGNAVRKGAAVSFSDMVLPSHRQYALSTIAHASSKGANAKGGGLPLLLNPGQQANDIVNTDRGIVAVGSNALKTIANGLGQGLKDLGL